MRSRWQVATVALTAVLAAPPLPSVRAAEPPAAIAKRETAARSKCAADLVKLSKSLAALKAFDEAREELRLASRLAPADPAPRKELAKLVATGETPETATDKVTEQRTAAHQACATELAAVLKAWDEADRPEEFGRLATTMKVRLDADETLKPWDLRWSDEYLVWQRPKDAERFGAGGEFVDGAWVDAEKVKALDASHAAWTSPWVVGDGVHEVRTTMPLRTAKRVLENVSQYRQAVLDYFAGEWDLRPPKGVLPVIVTATQAEYRQQIAAVTTAKGNPNAAAVYLRSPTPLNPCIVTFEPKDTDGSTKKVRWEGLLLGLRHEVGHQIAFEYLKYGPTGQAEMGWCSEGVANFLSYFDSKKGVWRLTRPAETPFATGFVPGAFAWVQQNFAQVPQLRSVVGEAKTLTSDTEYHVATTVAYFLLEGEGRRYRAPFLRLADVVHRGQCKPDSFDAVFGKVDAAKMQAEWEAFVKDISIEK